MAEQIYIGNFSKGQKADREPFEIDNDAFPIMFNFYSWRGRAKKKRGTRALARLQRQMTAALGNTGGAGNGTGTLSTFLGLEASSSIAPGFKFTVGAVTFGDTTPPSGILTGGGVTGTFNYVTGAYSFTGAPAATPATILFGYYPGLPVMGLRDLVPNSITTIYPLLIAFDTKYSYQLDPINNLFFYGVNYYKTTNTAFVWSGSDFQQFWTANYQSALWATNNKPGFHFKPITAIADVNPTTVTITIVAHGLVINDHLWINEVVGTIAAGNPSSSNINTQTGRVTGIVDVNNVTVTFDGTNGTSLATFPAASAGIGGIAQYLTNSIAGQDGIKWYDGDPTGTTGLPTGTGTGWVNFSPPLTAFTVGINDQTPALYYLVGALAIVPFKDRLLFFGPQIQSSTGTVIQQPIQDTVIFSWNGTPYYTALVPTSAFSSETFDPTAYYVDQTGKGGYQSAGISKPIVTVMPNEDVLLVGFGGTGKKTRLVYTSNDIQPFNFYLINSEMPSGCTFSGIAMDRGGIEIGPYGTTITTQQDCQRIDLDIPDSVFEIQAANNGLKRVNAVRDFYREWMFFAYPQGSGLSNTGGVFPTRSFMFNYRDNTWSVIKENFTAHGTFRRTKKITWSSLILPFTWNGWRETWASGSDTELFPTVVGGTPQGFVLEKTDTTTEAPSGYIQALADDGNGFTQITSINHSVELNAFDLGGDYLSFDGPSIGAVTRIIDADNFVIDIPFPSVANITNVSNAVRAVITLQWPAPANPPAINSYFIGQRVTIAGVLGTTTVNGTWTVLAVTPTSITVNADTSLDAAYAGGGTTTLVGYIGLATFTRLEVPFLQTKEFAFYWDQGKQLRLGPQKYLLDTTDNDQVTLNIYLSQNTTPGDFWNYGPVVPSANVQNSALIYSQVLYTCPESTNLGLTAANVNLQMPTAISQNQIWHRVNTSLIGDGVQLGITLSDLQMRNLDHATAEIVLHGIVLNCSASSHLA